MTFRRRKIAVIGSGFTGATAALMLAQKELGDIILVDIPSQTNPTKGKALDMLEAGPVQRFNASITGTSSYEDIQDADLVLITAGMPRKPGMSRDDLVAVNEKIMIEVSQNIKTYAPASYIIVLSNPVDAMTYVCYKTTGFPKNRVIGQSGVLDTARFNTFVAQELGVSIEDISGFVLGGHGDDMVPLVRYSYAGGIPLEKILPADRIEAIVERTRKGGGEIVNLLGQGSAYYAPAASMVEMAEAILKDKKRILPSIAYLEGEYGYNNIYLGVPTILGGNGIESVIEIPLTADEKEALDQSVKSVQNVMSILETAKG
ncbi:malate dehydrogenase [Cytobacillus firmus]|uniref:Malate dehydrogenase n=1 Tax=Cytobacillus firmus TaxID=1399 RepID=A0AA46P9D5_CYTFI|nr:malate dehydrogenase [Cytobacillus firmus]KML37349.1 malate dehydrogenase [Cytobacillus firmus]MCS0653002.1 malate dehydrogenase [Cytobacillus firmus]UYG95746.1 malate dehydrogenase [Cytobacillus firmus]